MISSASKERIKEFLKHRYSKLFSIVLMISLLAYLFFKYDFSGTFDSVSWHWLYLWPILFSISLTVRFIGSHQVAMLMRLHDIPIQTARVFRYQMMSGFYALFLPGVVVGSGVSWYLLTRDHKKHVEVISCLGYVRMLTTIMVILVGIIMSFFDTSIGEYAFRPYLGIGAFCLSLFLLPFIVPGFYRLFSSMIPKDSSRTWVSKFLSLFHRVMVSAENASQIGLSKIFVHAFWSCSCVLLGAVSMKIAFLLADIHTPWMSCFWLRAVLGVIYLLPFTIAGLGVREVTLITLLQAVYGIEPHKGLLLSIVAFLTMMVMSGVFGGAMHFVGGKKVPMRK